MDLETNPFYYSLFRRPTTEEKKAIESDIIKNEQRLPIIVERDLTVNKTYIVDGYTRNEILKKHGIEPKVEYRTFKNTEEAVRFLFSVNNYRRHLSDYDMVKSSLILLEQESRHAAKRKKNGTKAQDCAKGKASEKIAKVVGVKSRQYEKILAVIKSKNQKLIDSLASGRMRPNTAYHQLKIYNNAIEPMSFPSGYYSAAVIDPPWNYSDKNTNYGNYNSLTKEEIINYKDQDGRKIPDTFAPHCTVYLCTTGPMMDEAVDIIRAWNLRWSSMITWGKVDANFKIQFLQGRRVNDAAEYVIVATKGKPVPPTPENRPPGLILASRTRNSQKPEKLFEIIEKAHPSQKWIDIFSRKKRPGWDVFGNPPEIEGYETDETTNRIKKNGVRRNEV